MMPPSPETYQNPSRPRSLPLRLLKAIFGSLLALVILFEEWGWEPLQRALAWVGRLPCLRWLEAHIQTLPPYVTLALFLLPTLLAQVRASWPWRLGLALKRQAQRRWQHLKAAVRTG